MTTTNLLTCPIRGPLNAAALAKDGLTVTEEARRIDLLNFLLGRKYPPSHIAVETIILKKLGESGRNKLRCDVIVYDEPVSVVRHLQLEERLKQAILVAEVKRDSASKKSGLAYQLEPAMRLLPSMTVMGAYWDNVERLLYVKRLVKKNGTDYVDVCEDSLESLPTFGGVYAAKPITLDQLSPPKDLVAILYNVANAMRSHGINDEHLRYKETVKLILARYCDERQAAASKTTEVSLQVLAGKDPDFLQRVGKCYLTAAQRYQRAKTLFQPSPKPGLKEVALRDVVKKIQGTRFLTASNEAMQQVFMSFVPSVFKKSLDQYFTPLSLIDTMVAMVGIGPNDTIADPGMGTADFLTSAMSSRARAGDTDIDKRIYGMDVDDKAYELAIVNMILNKDGQNNLQCGDSIEQHTLWQDSINVALCNPPFGENSTVSRSDVLRNYDLAHVWVQNQNGTWRKTDDVLPSQQLGILFIERCYKLLATNGRMAIILPEGYLCTARYGYIRQWIIDHLRVVALIELPRRIFLKSDADLRANIVVLQKCGSTSLKMLIKADYPIFCELVRRVGYKLGKGFSVIPRRDPVSGTELRTAANELIPDSEFDGVRERFASFVEKWKCWEPASAQVGALRSWKGGRVRDVLQHDSLDLKPRRLTYNALKNGRDIIGGEHVKLGDIADIVTDTIELDVDPYAGRCWRLVEGMDIRAVEGVVVPQYPMRAWQIVEKKSASMYQLKHRDIVVGLVRPERRNLGVLVADGDDIVGSPDGVAIVRVKKEKVSQYPAGWLFEVLRSEKVRLQFWTESGGTSYGKLTPEDIAGVLLPVPPKDDRACPNRRFDSWFGHMTSASKEWESVGSQEDRRPIMNSPMLGLEAVDFEEDN